MSPADMSPGACVLVVFVALQQTARVAAVDSLDAGEQNDPDTLERVPGAATPITVESGAAKTVRLKMTTGV